MTTLQVALYFWSDWSVKVWLPLVRPVSTPRESPVAWRLYLSSWWFWTKVWIFVFVWVHCRVSVNHGGERSHLSTNSTHHQSHSLSPRFDGGLFWNWLADGADCSQAGSPYYWAWSGVLVGHQVLSWYKDKCHSEGIAYCQSESYKTPNNPIMLLTHVLSFSLLVVIYLQSTPLRVLPIPTAVPIACGGSTTVPHTPKWRAGRSRKQTIGGQKNAKRLRRHQRE